MDNSRIICNSFGFSLNWLSRKISTDLLLFFSCSTVTLGVAFLFFNNVSYFFLACSLYGLGVPGSVALILVEGKKRFIGNVNISVAIMTTAFSIGQIFGPMFPVCSLI